MRSTRFAVRGLAVAAALTLALAACDEDEVAPPPVIEVTVTPSAHTMKVGEQVTLHASVKGTQNQSVTWESNTPSVATVNASSGVVTAVSPGTAVIIAKSAADQSATGAATITVEEAPTPTIEVTVVPQTATIQVGQTLPLTAVVSGTTNQTVTWSSRTPSVATVDASSGVVTGVAPGTAVIEAKSAADPNAVPGIATVTVLPEVPVTVVIQDIRIGGQSANRNNLAGQVEVVVEFDAPAGSNVSKVEVLVDEDLVCSQNIGSGEASLGEGAESQATFVCSILTDEYDPATGAPRFVNGDHQVSARITTSTGSVRAEAGERVRFNNEDTWVLNVEPEKGPEADDDGAAWYGGDVVVTGLPVLYSGRTVTSAQFSFFGVVKAATANEDGTFSATYTATTDIAGMLGGDINLLTLVDAAVYEGGQAATTFVREWQVNGETVVDDPGDLFELRLDNEAPDFTAFELTAASSSGNPAENLCCSNGWVGADYEFAAGLSGADDSGVGLAEVKFYWGDAAASEGDIIAAGQVVERGADIPETQTNTEVKVVAVITDRLDNHTVVALGPIGVDHGAPELGDPTGPEDGDINPAAANWTFGTPADTLSGVDASGFGIASVVRNFGPASAADCELGVYSAGPGVCVPVVVDGTVAVPSSDGYFTMSYAQRDRAGNLTAADPVTILVDGTAPTVSGPPVFPATLTGGQPATFSIARVADNVDLEAFDLRFEFGSVVLPMGPWKVVGDGFGGDLVTEVTNQTYEVSHFIRLLQTTNADGTPAASAAPTAIQFRGRDVAGNIGASAPFVFAGGTVPAGQDASQYAPDLQTFTVASDQTSICDIEVDGSCGSVPQSATISAVVTGPSGSFTNPYARVWFFLRDASSTTDVEAFLGEATSANQEEESGPTGDRRTFTYKFTLNGRGIGARPVHIIAVAITKDGDALVSQHVAVDVVP